MAKKKKNKGYKSFSSMLKNNSDVIKVNYNDEKMNLEKATSLSVKGITSVPEDSVIEVSATESSENRENVPFTTDVRYAKSAFTLYEQAMRHPQMKQTLVMTFTDKEVVDLFDYGMNETINTLMERTNISLILKEMEKAKNRIRKWIEREPSTEMEIFILNIPDIVLFTGKIQKKEISPSILFNLCIQVVKTKRPMQKIQKRDPEKYSEITKNLIDHTITNVMNLGHSWIHVGWNSELIKDVIEYSEMWKKSIEENETVGKLINSIIFSIDNSEDFIEFSNHYIR